MTEIEENELGFNRVKSIIKEKTVSICGGKKAKEIGRCENIDEISEKQNKISNIKKLIERGNDLPLSNFSDIREEMNRCTAQGTYFAIEVLEEVKKLLIASEKISDFYSNHKNSIAALEPIVEEISTYSEILSSINGIVDKDGEIKDNASNVLRKIRNNISAANRKLRNEVNNSIAHAREKNWLRKDKPTIRNGRYVLPMKTKAKRKIDGIIHGKSGSGATTYVEPLSVVEANNHLKELKEQEQEEIKRILKEITSRIRPEFQNLERNIDLLARLDMLRACAVFSIDFECNPPKVFANNEEQISLIKARHPLLSLVKDVVPLDFQPPQTTNTVIITGPNAGGKTVAMKTVGLLGKMAMCGLHIPASIDSKIPYFDKFLIDIGDRQSIEDDLSTFSAHIGNLKSIMKDATSNTLVLIDELGTGTDPIEGSALGQSILERLLNIGAFTITTTHHSSLKAFADKNDEVVNAAMEFDKENLNPKYELSIGLPGNSYALEIAERLGVDQDIIDRSRELLGSDNVKLENLLSEVEETKAELKKEKNKVEQRKKTLDKVVSDYENKVENIKEKQNKLDSTLSDELEKMVEESRSKIENTIKKIKEQDADKESIKEAHNTVEKIEKKAKKKKKKTQEQTTTKVDSVTEKENEEIKTGIWVKVKMFNQKGEVKSVNEDNISVDINGKTLQVDRSGVVPIEKPKENSTESMEVNLEGNTNPDMSLHLRGMRYDEAKAELEKYLDNVLLSDYNEVEIVHGKGEGVLREMTHKVLDKHPNVKNYYSKKPRAGGSGVTVVKF